MLGAIPGPKKTSILPPQSINCLTPQRVAHGVAQRLVARQRLDDVQAPVDVASIQQRLLQPHLGLEVGIRGSTEGRG